MLYRQAGKTGQMLSILGFGCMRLPILEGKAHLIDEEKAQAMVDYAIRNGVNYFDTAYVYHSEVPFQAGMSEVFLGRALRRAAAEGPSGDQAAQLVCREPGGHGPVPGPSNSSGCRPTILTSTSCTA